MFIVITRKCKKKICYTFLYFYNMCARQETVVQRKCVQKIFQKIAKKLRKTMRATAGRKIMIFRVFSKVYKSRPIRL